MRRVRRANGSMGILVTFGNGLSYWNGLESEDTIVRVNYDVLK